MNIKTIIGFLWALPVTLFGLVYALLFNVLGWYKLLGVYGDAITWQVNKDSAPGWLNRVWTGWAGHTIGNVVVLNCSLDDESGKVTLRHEQKHVDQCMRLGIFQPIMYALIYVSVWWGCPGSSPYFSNSFEVDARRAAGQFIDRG